MKKLLTLSICALLGLSAMAQQLPNAGFEEAWVDCVPWTSAGNETVQGTTPTSWNVSNTIGTGGDKPTGNTTIADKVTGYNSDAAVKVFNKSIIFGKVIPGYFGLGTSWSTSKGTGKNMAGGQFDGFKFTYHPDALSFMYQSSGSNQPTVLAYIWNGTFVQENVSGNIVFSGEPIKVNMQNRDRNVIGMEEAPEGGKVTEKGTLISSINTRLNAAATDWTKAELEFNYVSDVNPEMINVIFAADDYFSAQPVKDNSITVDDVKLIYYSRLNSLKVGEKEVALIDGKYEYTFDFVMPENIEYTLKGQSATATVVRDEENHTATIKVTNVDADIDGEKEHNYVLTFAAPDKPIEGDEYNGKVTIEMLDAEITGGGTAANVIITSVDANTCIFTLPNFTLDLGGGPQLLGDIVVENVTVSERDGLKYYEGTKTGLELLGGDITADVTLTGTIDAEGNADMLIDVMWDGVPIYVDFFTKEREPETFGGFIGHKASADGAITNEYDGTMSLTCVSRNIYKFEMTGVDLDALSRATGNIVVENVLVTKDDKGNRTFAGESDNANAKVEGTIDAAKKATVKVEYKESADAEPKYIEFNTNKVQTGVDEIEAAGNGEVEYYNLQGIRVANPESGIYIRRQGSKVSKVYVK